MIKGELGQTAYRHMGARVVTDLVHNRDGAVAQTHDAVSLLREDFPSLSSFTAKNNWEAAIKQLQIVLYEPACTAAVLSCNSRNAALVP